MEKNINDWKVDLVLESVYFHSAHKHLDSAQEDYKPLSEVINTMFDIDKKIKAIEDKYGNIYDSYDEVEPFAIQLDSLYSELQHKYLPVIINIALVHILNALCLEAFINKIAIDNIEPKSSFDEFDRLSLEGKYLFFPKLIGKRDTFEKDKEPFQGFKNIIKWRNNLVHFKGKSEMWRSYMPPQFFDDFGLRLECAKKSCGSVEGMIKAICGYCNFSLPEWINGKYCYPFELEF